MIARRRTRSSELGAHWRKRRDSRTDVRCESLKRLTNRGKIVIGDIRLMPTRKTASLTIRMT